MKKLLIALALVLILALVGCSKEIEYAVDVEVVDVTNVRYACSYMSGCKYSSTIVYEYNGQEYTLYLNRATTRRVGDIMTVYISEDIYVSEANHD